MQGCSQPGEHCWLGQDLPGDGQLGCGLTSANMQLLCQHKLFKTPTALSLSERIWQSKQMKEIVTFLSAWGDFVNECFCA